MVKTLLDKEITRAEKDAASYKKIVQCLERDNAKSEQIESCRELYFRYKRIARWLKELKQRRHEANENVYACLDSE